MKRDASDPDYDPRRIGFEIARARAEAGLTQRGLASRCRTTQQRISYVEAATRPPEFDLLLRIARVLDLPLQRLISGADRAGTNARGLAVELRGLGLVDLHVPKATIPGSSRGPEEVVSLALAGASPDPRIISGIPALLAWNAFDPGLLAAHAARTNTTWRLAWLADVALAIEGRAGFPGRCFWLDLEAYLAETPRPTRSDPLDGLGFAAESPLGLNQASLEARLS